IVLRVCGPPACARAVGRAAPPCRTPVGLLSPLRSSAAVLWSGVPNCNARCNAGDGARLIGQDGAMKRIALANDRRTSKDRRARTRNGDGAALMAALERDEIEIL